MKKNEGDDDEKEEDEEEPELGDFKSRSTP
jgi:hypothetical protein